LAHALRAVDIAVLGVAYTATGLAPIPGVIVKGSGILVRKIVIVVVVRDGGVRHILDVGASTVTGAVIGAGSSLAALALVTGEALALA